MIETPADYRSFVFCHANETIFHYFFGLPSVDLPSFLLATSDRAIRFIFCFAIAAQKRMPLLSTYAQPSQLKSCFFLIKLSQLLSKNYFAQTTTKNHSNKFTYNYTMKNTLIAPSVLAADFGSATRHRNDQQQ
jgi:hypothetical protein